MTVWGHFSQNENFLLVPPALSFPEDIEIKTDFFFLSTAILASGLQFTVA